MDEDRKTARWRRRRIIYNNDGDDVIEARPGALDWDGRCYHMAEPYSVMEFPQETGALNYRHHMSSLFGGLIDNGLAIEEVLDHPWSEPDPAAKPGTWSHEMAYNVSIIIVARA